MKQFLKITFLFSFLFFSLQLMSTQEREIIESATFKADGMPLDDINTKLWLDTDQPNYTL
jgi:hypothetical protein